MAEHWLPIPGYEGRYEVSDKGRVKRLPFIDKAGAVHERKFLKKEYSKRGRKGYRKVALIDTDGNIRKWFVHRLVLLAFVGPCPEGMEVCHTDGNGKNNRLDNLRYDTRSENQRDVSRVGHRHNGIDDISMITDIRSAYERGDSVRKIADDRGLKYNTVYDIVKGNTYTWV